MTTPEHVAVIDTEIHSDADDEDYHPEPEEEEEEEEEDSDDAPSMAEDDEKDHADDSKLSSDDEPYVDSSELAIRGDEAHLSDAMSDEAPTTQPDLAPCDGRAIPAAPFTRLVCQILRDVPQTKECDPSTFKVTRDALQALQDGAEAYITGIFHEARAVACIGHRLTVTPKDFRHAAGFPHPIRDTMTAAVSQEQRLNPHAFPFTKNPALTSVKMEASASSSSSSTSSDSHEREIAPTNASFRSQHPRVSASSSALASSPSLAYDPNTCVICIETSREVFFSPCNHIATCQACGDAIFASSQSCPICRKPITEVKKFFVV